MRCSTVFLSHTHRESSASTERVGRASFSQTMQQTGTRESSRLPSDDRHLSLSGTVSQTMRLTSCILRSMSRSASVVIHRLVVRDRQCIGCLMRTARQSEAVSGSMFRMSDSAWKSGEISKAFSKKNPLLHYFLPHSTLSHVQS